MHRQCRFVMCCICVFALAQLGCGDSLPRQKTYAVKGQVLLDGKPVSGATLVFHPIDTSKFKWQERPQGKTDAEGRFTLTTYDTGDGAPAADYLVGIAVIPTGSEDDGSDQQRRGKVAVRLPQAYASHQTSNIKAKVESRATTLEPFALKSN